MFNIFKSKKKEILKSEPQLEIDDNQLLQNGFDPIKDVKVQDTGEIKFDFSQDYQGYISPPPQEIFQSYLSFQFLFSIIIIQTIKKRPFSTNDEFRHPDANPQGGLSCQDQRIIQLERKVAMDMIKEMGKKLISGDFNLTRIPFPVCISLPKTALETAANSQALFPLYVNVAMMQSDPQSRFSYIMIAILGAYSWQSYFLKPLNPILGETLEMSYNDGSKYYAEQISHHPPINYFYMIGQNGAYKYYGYYNISASAGLNSLTISNNGKRVFIFKDGQRIDMTYPDESYRGTFLGQTRQLTCGKVIFEDKQNQIYCKIEFGGVKKRPEDYFHGKIKVKGQQVSIIEGSYLSHIELNGKRLWDIRYIQPHKMNFREQNLESDHSKRNDVSYLKIGQLQLSQSSKNKLEEDQRHDAKLRENYKKLMLKNKNNNQK